MKSSEDRKKAIIEDTPAFFDIRKKPDADSSKPLLELDCFDEVDNNEAIFNEVASMVNIDSDLVKAVAYLESTHGFYDRMVVNPSSFRPMNINYNEWKELCTKLGYTEEKIKNNIKANIHVGAVLLKRIKERIKNPTVEKIGSIYNYMGREHTNDYGARLQVIYDEKLWEKN